MKAQETTLAELLAGAKQFRVPLYQRTYSWDKKQWEPLWKAIVEQAEEVSEEEAGHFLGSVVLAPGPSTPTGPHLWIVVDGQQRLTTLALVLCALRDRVRAENIETARYLHEEYLINRRHQDDSHLKLLPTQADRAAFGACVRGEADAGGPGRIGEAYRFFQQKLEEYDDPDDPHDLQRIETAIVRRMEIVSINAEQGDNVHRIFESLNNTGLALSQADLLRNYYFMLLPTRGEHVYTHLWRPLQDKLGTPGLELLAWLDLVMRGQSKVRRDDVYRAQHKRLKALESKQDEAAVEAEVAEFARRGHLLGLIRDPAAAEPDPRLREALRRLREWDATTTYPLVMSLLDRRSQGTASTDEVVEALGYVESFLVRRMLCGVPVNNLNRVLNAAPPEVADGPVAGKVRQYLSRERHYWSDDEALRDAIKDRNFYWSGRAEQRQFVLRRLEEAHQHREPVDWQRASLSIEHVMPQTLSQVWRRDLKALLAPGQTVNDVHGALLHTLGNLTLTGYNSPMGNKAFAEKRAVFANSGLAMNHAIASHEVWGPEEILARADGLAERAIALWPGPVERLEVHVANPKWRLLRQAVAALPAGTWTTCGDLATLVGSYPAVVARHLAANALPNSWRVLTIEGTALPEFRWPEPDRQDDPMQVLVAEGVTLVDGAADDNQRLWAAEVAEILGLDTDTLIIPGQSDPALVAEFWKTANDDDAHQPMLEGLRGIVAAWGESGGELRVDPEDPAVGYLCRQEGARLYVPMMINLEEWYIEIPFSLLRTAKPFDDQLVRNEFRLRCNGIDGVALAASKIDHRPWFSLDVLGNGQAHDAARRALAWFIDIVR